MSFQSRDAARYVLVIEKHTEEPLVCLYVCLYVCVFPNQTKEEKKDHGLVWVKSFVFYSEFIIEREDASKRCFLLLPDS